MGSIITLLGWFALVNYATTTIAIGVCVAYRLHTIEARFAPHGVTVPMSWWRLMLGPFLHPFMYDHWTKGDARTVAWAMRILPLRDRRAA